MSAPSYEIRSAERRDGKAIRALFHTVFGGKRSAEHWRWKFDETPYPNLQIALATDKTSDSLVGHHALTPVSMNVMGRRVIGAQSLDTMVHPDAQRQGLFEQTANHCYARAAENDVAFVFGLPNRNSYPGFVRKLGWKRVGFLRYYLLRLRVRDPLQRAFGSRVFAALGDLAYRTALALRLRFAVALRRRRLGGGVRFVLHDAAPEGCDALWNQVRSYEVLSGWKDHEYLAWRYDRHPDRRFEYCTLERNGNIAALAVVEVSGSTELRICELLVRDRNVLLGSLLVHEIALHYRAKGPEVLVFRGLDAGFFDAVFESFHAETDFELVFGARSLGDPALAEIVASPRNWTITTGDTDLV